MVVLVTGAAGFIGYHLCEHLLQQGYTVVGLDSLSSYYAVSLKYDRLAQLGISQETVHYNRVAVSHSHAAFHFIHLDLENQPLVLEWFAHYRFDAVCHLAAQAGVRFCMEQPYTYVDSNVTGFLTVLEGCRQYGISKLVYASSSSVYGLNAKVPFAVGDPVDQPISLYAVTKRSNELMAHTYSQLFGIQTVGFRFFTVYGPWGRPDMAMHLFVDAIEHGQPLAVFNHGDLSRDFTYISDIISGMDLVLQPLLAGTYTTPYALYNLGNSKPIPLLEFIQAIENATGKKAQLDYLPMQPGDVRATWADVSPMQSEFGYQPVVSVPEGVAAFYQWYQSYYLFEREG